MSGRAGAQFAIFTWLCDVFIDGLLQILELLVVSTLPLSLSPSYVSECVRACVQATRRLSATVKWRSIAVTASTR